MQPLQVLYCCKAQHCLTWCSLQQQGSGQPCAPDGCKGHKGLWRSAESKDNGWLQLQAAPAMQTQFALCCKTAFNPGLQFTFALLLHLLHALMIGLPDNDRQCSHQTCCQPLGSNDQAGCPQGQPSPPELPPTLSVLLLQLLQEPSEHARQQSANAALSNAAPCACLSCSEQCNPSQHSPHSFAGPAHFSRCCCSSCT